MGRRADQKRSGQDGQAGDTEFRLLPADNMYLWGTGSDCDMPA